MGAPRFAPTLLHGVELQTFMSYESAFVPLGPGLNLIVGPNGSGKSSILLGISLVLGQAHTERAKRLSALIRWGTDGARVSLVLDNATPEGGRLFPHAREEKVTVTRVLRANGDYLYLIDGRPIPKQEGAEAGRRPGRAPPEPRARPRMGKGRHAGGRRGTPACADRGDAEGSRGARGRRAGRGPPGRFDGGPVPGPALRARGHREGPPGDGEETRRRPGRGR